jgi:cytochrome c oxidase cbb3-type subunit 1
MAVEEEYRSEERRLLKFIVASGMFLFIGTVHGVAQIQRPVREWLDAIGSPYGGPGHMIDPLAHAHINVIGGVVLLLMAVSYFLMPRISGKRLFSYKLVDHTFWWTALGIAGFYSTLMFFGIWEGTLMLEDKIEEMERVHSTYYVPLIATVSTVMGMGFWIYFFNLFATYKRVRNYHKE